MDYADAKRASYIGFLHRHPFATDAYELGFAPGVREDYSYCCQRFPNVDLPVVILDNDFRDPDVGRYLERFERYDPSVAVLGDAYSREDAIELNEVGYQIKREHPHKEVVVVPKCADALEIIDEDLVAGYAMGYSEVTADTFSDIVDWRGRRVHLLGASPHRQNAVIEALTQPNLTNDPPADIVGLDWNGLHKVAYLGEYWTEDGWRRADHLSIRDTVRSSLREVKQFWVDRGVWPDTEPIDIYGPAVREPDDTVYAVNGGDITTRDELESAIVVSYDDCTLAYRTETEQGFLEWRESLTYSQP